jgi:hypothetical protein
MEEPPEELITIGDDQWFFVEAKKVKT